MVFARLPSIYLHDVKITKKELSLNHLCLHNFFQFVNASCNLVTGVDPENSETGGGEGEGGESPTLSSE